MVCHAPQTSGRRKKFVGTCAEGNSVGLRNVKREGTDAREKGNPSRDSGQHAHVL
jgi:hypothetical protein